MENASKALIIAGSILIAIMIISLGVVIFNKFSESAKSGANLDEQEIGQFNSKITPYIGESITGSQVNNLIQYVISNNLSVVSGELEAYKAIKITFPIGDGTTTNTIEVKKNGSDLEMSYGGHDGPKRVTTGASAYYKVKPTYSDEGLITTIEVKKAN